MKSFPWKILIFTILAGGILWNYFAGLPAVPFHPDESTQIFMSADVSSHLQDVFYSPGDQTGVRGRYRLIDSPLSRTLMGWALHLSGISANPVDWNWSADWAENEAAGALPSSGALLTARWAVAWVFPLTCVFLFLLARKMAGKQAALLAVLFFSTNALVLIHTRRAMAESVLLCAFTGLAWLLVDFRKTSWLAAITAALAVNAKQTSLPLAAIGGLQYCFLPKKAPAQKRLLNVFSFAAILLTISGLLNPAYWNHPLSALNAGLRERNALNTQMREDYHTSINPLEQGLILTVRTFFQPPAVADVMNYAVETEPAEKAYFANPLNTLFNGFTGGACLLILTLFGWIVLWRQVDRKQLSLWHPLTIFTVITGVSVGMLMFFTAAPFQRYYVILIPLFSTVQGAALAALWNGAVTWIRKRTAVSDSPR